MPFSSTMYKQALVQHNETAREEDTMTPSSSEASPPQLNGIKTNKSFQIKLAKNQQEIQRRKMLQDGGPNSSEGITSTYKMSDPTNPSP